MYNRPGVGWGGVRHELRLAPPPPGTGVEDVTAEGQAAARVELPQRRASREEEGVHRPERSRPTVASSSPRPLLQG